MTEPRTRNIRILRKDFNEVIYELTPYPVTVHAYGIGSLYATLELTDDQLEILSRANFFWDFD